MIAPHLIASPLTVSEVSLLTRFDGQLIVNDDLRIVREVPELSFPELRISGWSRLYPYSNQRSAPRVVDRKEDVSSTEIAGQRPRVPQNFCASSRSEALSGSVAVERPSSVFARIRFHSSAAAAPGKRS